MATYSQSECIDRLGAWVKDRNEHSNERQMIMKVIGDRYIVESRFFNYEDVQKMQHMLVRTSCEWWIKPVDHETVQLRIRFF